MPLHDTGRSNLAQRHGQATVEDVEFAAIFASVARSPILGCVVRHMDARGVFETPGFRRGNLHGTTAALFRQGRMNCYFSHPCTVLNVASEQTD